MIWTDNTFPYINYKSKGTLFKPFDVEQDIDDENEEGCDKFECYIDYAEEFGLYRITKFKNNHWAGDIVFNEITNAYCPVCGKERWIPDTEGYCCKCGNHLVKGEI